MGRQFRNAKDEERIDIFYQNLVNNYNLAYYTIEFPKDKYKEIVYFLDPDIVIIIISVMGLRIGIATFADQVHSPGAGITFECSTIFRRYQLPHVILTPSFFPRGKHLSSTDARFVFRNLILPKVSKPNGHSMGLFRAV
ncbi:hypothetical protein TNCV_2385631 [Trichonephila clavipes]|nr:hypothetical protein TNCV_2385631 [Trichonephila clavipes]